jgi:hypothetical protein
MRDDPEQLSEFISLDVPVLLNWGAGSEFEVTWLGGYGESAPDELFYVSRGPDDAILGSEVAGYFFAIARVANDGYLDGRDDMASIAEAVFNIGYGMYISNNLLGSGSARQQVLVSAWMAASALKRRDAIQRRDNEAEKYWSEQPKLLDEFFQQWSANWLEQWRQR